jgi:hypothetical protein
MRRTRAAGPFEAVVEVVDFGRHVPLQSAVGDHFDSTNSYVYIIDWNSRVSIRSAPSAAPPKATGVLTARQLNCLARRD